MRKEKVSLNYMDIVFVHAQDKPFNIDENGIVTVDVPNTGFFNKLAQRFWDKPKVSHIELDKFGSVMWLAIDGNNTVQDVYSLMEDSFPEEDRMLDRVVTFMHTLQNNGFVVVK